MLKKIPEFENEDQEQEFWAVHDSTEYIDWSKAGKINFPKLKPSTRTISIRLPEMMIDDLKTLANRSDVPYQTLIKMYLAERISLEIRKRCLSA